MTAFFRLALAIAIATAAAGSRMAFADVLTLDNGDRLSGRIEHKSGAALILTTAYAGRISLAGDRVVSVVTDATVGVMLRDSDRITSSRLLSGAAGRIVLESSGGDAALAQVAYINPTPAESGYGTSYSGRATLSATNVRRNNGSAPARRDTRAEAERVTSP